MGVACYSDRQKPRFDPVVVNKAQLMAQIGKNFKLLIKNTVRFKKRSVMKNSLMVYGHTKQIVFSCGGLSRNIDETSVRCTVNDFSINHPCRGRQFFDLGIDFFEYLRRIKDIIISEKIDPFPIRSF